MVYVYYQHDVCTHESRAMSLLVHQLIGEKLFDQLRTKEQLGYVASGSLETLYDVGGFRVTVESAFHSPEFVEERVDAFLLGFPAQVRAMDDAEFVKTRRSLVDSVLTMDVSLSAEADRHWTHVSNQKYQFYRGQIIAGLIDGVSKREVVAWLEANLAPTAAAPATRRVTIHVHGKNHPLNGAARNASRNALGADAVAALKKSGATTRRRATRQTCRRWRCLPRRWRGSPTSTSRRRARRRRRRGRRRRRAAATKRRAP